MPRFYSGLAALSIAFVYMAPHSAAAASDSHGCNAITEPSINTYVRVCFKTTGDQVWVQDRESDGASAVGRITTPSGQYNYYCKNSAGAGTWRYCNRNLPEGGPIGYRGYTKDGSGPYLHETDLAFEYNVNGT